MKNSLLAVFLFVVSSSTAQTSDTSLTKNNNVPVNTDSVYTKVDVEAQFPGGDKQWNQFVQKEVETHIREIIDNSESIGVCTIKFIVDREGNISAARALNMEGSKLAKYIIKAILKGPTWIPATVNGINVKSIRLQKVTFSTSAKN